MGQVTRVIGNPAGGRDRARDSRGSGPHAWAASTLTRQEMPSEEIRAVLAAHDPETVRRYLELHRERLEERLTEQRRTLADLERFLTRSDSGTHQARRGR
jgi:ATP/maltotriose-dependent transcriptional regulator MalT